VAEASWRVIKLGGSLLPLTDLPDRLQRWLSGQPPWHNVVIGGGGEFAEAVREADRRFQLSPQAAHWLAIDAMRITWSLLAHLIPSAVAVERYELLEDLVQRSSPPHAAEPRAAAPQLVLFDCGDFLRHHEPTVSGPAIPHSWQTTSDSIAARLATAIGAAELVLLKSALPPEPATIQHAADVHYVDGFFPQTSMSIDSIRCIDLSSAEFPESRLTRRSRSRLPGSSLP
jgi:aspartokinase-like uncharacterized kinase